MTNYTLTVIDALGIQEYIFGSNRLRENLGASQLITNVTGDWLHTALQKAVGTAHNMREDNTPDPEHSIAADNDIQAEVIFAGGGNALLLFRDRTKAIECIGLLSRTLLTDAPGLDIVVAHEDFDWATEPIGGGTSAKRDDGRARSAQARLMSTLNRAKQQRPASTPILGQSVTLECRSTGLPAVEFGPDFGDESGEPLSADILAKIQKPVLKLAKERFIEQLPGVARPPHFALRDDFDDLGGTEDDQSYIAVVHADGNGMGRRFQQALNEFSEPGQNRACINVLRGLSLAVDGAGKTAIKNSVERMVRAMTSSQPGDEMNIFFEGLKRLNRDNIRRQYKRTDIENMRVLPFRLIVAGGDDMTFVCDGRLGLNMAAAYLQEWERAMAAELAKFKQSLDQQKIALKDTTILKPATACAGVAVVKTHYPFARAYELSARLCDLAKAEVERKVSALDWHFALSGLSGSIHAIREREYASKDGSLVMRPIRLSAEDKWRSWNQFERLVRIFKGQIKVKQVNGRTIPDESGTVYANRNRVKALREALRAGEGATERFRNNYRLWPLPFLDASNDRLQTTGWNTERCGYFDAIEAADFFLPVAAAEEAR